MKLFHLFNPFKGLVPAARSVAIFGPSVSPFDFRLKQNDDLFLKKKGRSSSKNSEFVIGAPYPPEAYEMISFQNPTGGNSLQFHLISERIDDFYPDNDYNGFCENGEGCLYAPNFGAHQGHGKIGTCLSILPQEVMFKTSNSKSHSTALNTMAHDSLN